MTIPFGTRPPPSPRVQVGDFSVTKILEAEYALPPAALLPQATSQALSDIEWLSPAQVSPSGKLRISVHALVVQTPDRRIVVDTCVGNDKRDRDMPAWNGLRTNFLERLSDAGFAPETIDTVLCTHLHLDHVGWNTRLVNGRWRPTFPRARHLIARSEMDHWKARAQDDRETRAVFHDSIDPLLEAGQVDWIDLPHTVAEGIWLVPTPGHTPGHASVALQSRGKRALISGDALHHPCQIAFPAWEMRADHDGRQARQTRRRMLEACCNEGILLLGTHFCEPSAGHVVASESGYRFDT